MAHKNKGLEMTQKEFSGLVCDLYYKWKEKFDNHEVEDWEQEYFNELTDKCDTTELETLIHLYYWDDDTTGEVAQGVLDSLEGKTLVMSSSFDDDCCDCTIVAMLVKKEVK